MKVESLEALNVFFDSSIFIGKNYHYEHPSFVALKEAVLAERVNLLITEITIEEVKAHIIEDVGKSSQYLKKVRSSVRILRNIPELSNSAIFVELDCPSLEGQLIKQFADFLSELKATVIPISGANTNFVFDCYFKRIPPFGDGKKKVSFQMRMSCRH